MKKYVCTVCGYVYDPEIGDPDSGIAAGTAFEDIPDGWVCPVCGVGKEMFEAKKTSRPQGRDFLCVRVLLKFFEARGAAVRGLL